jgi:hypothetical protein
MLAMRSEHLYPMNGNQDIENFELNDNKNNVSAKTKEQVANGGYIREVTWKDAAKCLEFLRHCLLLV